MPGKFDSIGGRRRVLRALWTCLLAGGGTAARAGSGAGHMISRITIVQDCFGCATGSTLVLQRDGTARHMVTGKARHGTEDRSWLGEVRPQDFEALASLVQAAGFFEMDEGYEDPQVADGAWSTITITRGGQDKQVFRRGQAGPESLTQIEAAAQALKARILFRAESR